MLRLPAWLRVRVRRHPPPVFGPTNTVALPPAQPSFTIAVEHADMEKEHIACCNIAPESFNPMASMLKPLCLRRDALARTSYSISFSVPVRINVHRCRDRTRRQRTNDFQMTVGRCMHRGPSSSYHGKSELGFNAARLMCVLPLAEQNCV